MKAFTRNKSVSIVVTGVFSGMTQVPGDFVRNVSSANPNPPRTVGTIGAQLMQKIAGNRDIPYQARTSAEFDSNGVDLVSRRR